MKSILFKFLDLILFFRPKDGTIIQRLSCVEEGPTHQRLVPVGSSSHIEATETWYTFSGRVYRTREWPVKRTGFVVPWTKSEPEVPWFDRYAGPKRDFHGSQKIYLPAKIRRFPYLTVEFTEKGFRLLIRCGYLVKYDPEMKIKNLLNQTITLPQYIPLGLR